jgi:hypothetical protein
MYFDFFLPFLILLRKLFVFNSLLYNRYKLKSENKL